MQPVANESAAVHAAVVAGASNLFGGLRSLIGWLISFCFCGWMELRFNFSMCYQKPKNPSQDVYRAIRKGKSKLTLNSLTYIHRAIYHLFKADNDFFRLASFLSY